MPVRLDNWLKLAHTLMPAFFLVLEYEGKQEPQRAYLVHVWEDLIAATLRRQRETVAAGKTIGRKMTMSLQWAPEHLLAECSGEALHDAMSRRIGANSQDYVLRKIELIQTVGYDAMRHAGKFTIAGASDRALFEDLARHAMGEKEFVEVQGFTMAERRFGIELPIGAPWEVAKAKFGVRPSPIKASIRITNRDQSRIVHDECEVYSAVAAFPFLPPDFRSVKIKGSYLAIIIDPCRRKIRISAELPPYEEPVPLDALTRAAAVLQMMADREEDGMQFELQSPENSIHIEEHQIGSANLDLGVLPLLSAVRECADLFEKLGCTTATKVTLAEIDLVARGVAGALTLLREPTSGVRYGFEIRGHDRPKEGKAAAIFMAAVELGGYFLGGVFSARGLITFERDDVAAPWRAVMPDCAVKVEERYVAPAGQSALVQLRDRARKAAKVLEGAGIGDIYLIDVEE